MATAFRVLFALVSISALAGLAIFLFQIQKVTSGTLYRLTGPLHLLSARDKAYFFLVLAAIVFISFKGVEGMLFWMPSSWGHIDESGDFLQTKTLLAALIGVPGGFGLAHALENAVRAQFDNYEMALRCDGLNKIINATSVRDLDYVLTGFNRSIDAIKEGYRSSEHLYLQQGPEGGIYRIYRHLIEVAENHKINFQDK